MIRYNIDCPYHRGVMIEQVEEGEWVRYKDIEALVTISANVTDRHDRFLKALRSIAALPGSMSSVASDALEGRRGKPD